MKEKEEKLMKIMDKFEEGFPDGVYVEPIHTKELRLRMKELSQYCRKKGCVLKDLTDKEREQFIIYKEDEGQ